MIPYGHQHLEDDDIEAVVAVLRGDRLTQGPHIEEFEDAVATYCDAQHAVAFSSGTAALHGAAAAAGLGPGSLVATSPLSFAASANCARYCGADVTFVDIDPDTLNLDPSLVPSTADALVAVHYAGLPMDLTALSTRPPVVIEDAAHALGAHTPDGPVGNCAHSDMTCFSFHPVKAVTTGEGGMVTTNSGELADRLRTFRHHGIRRHAGLDPWAYEIEQLGYNYRLTDIQAALGTSQLRKLDQFVGRRNELAERYCAQFADLPDIVPPPAPPEGWVHARHLYAVRVPERRRVHAALHAHGVGAQVHYVPTYRFAAYAADGNRPEDFPATEGAYAGLLSLPLFPDLTDDEQDTVVATVKEVLG